MKIIPYEELKNKLHENPYKEHNNFFFDAMLKGYDFEISDLIPARFIMNITSDLELSARSLQVRVRTCFNESLVMKRGSEVNYYILGLEFEEETFIVWFNTTRKGTTIDTPCRDLAKFHRFCIAFLQKIEYAIPDNNLWIFDSFPLLIPLNRKIPNDFINEHLLSNNVFNTNTNNRYA